MSRSIELSAAGLVLEGALYSEVTAQLLAEVLPIELTLARHGDAYIGPLRRPIGATLSPEARRRFEPGELAWLPLHNEICVLFGPTPESASGEAELASPANPIGRLRGPLDALRGLGSSVRFELRLAERDPLAILGARG